MKKTERALLLYKFIVAYSRDHQYSPSHDEMRAGAKLKSKSNIKPYLDILVGKGLIGYRDGMPRALWLVRGVTSALRVPLLGSISAGHPIPEFDRDTDDLEQVLVDGTRLPVGLAPAELFALKVDGDSMTDAEILDGDIVILTRDYERREGDILAFCLDDGTATLKRYYQKGTTVSMEPANDEYQTRSIHQDHVGAYGKVVQIIRTLGR